MNRKHKVLLKFPDILCYNVSGSIARRNILRNRKSVMKVIFIVIVAVLIVLFIISIYHQIHLKKEAEFSAAKLTQAENGTIPQDAGTGGDEGAFPKAAGIYQRRT